jgi:hypothetical protein
MAVISKNRDNYAELAEHGHCIIFHLVGSYISYTQSEM